MNVKKTVLILLSIVCVQKSQGASFFEQNNVSKIIKQSFIHLKQYNQKKRQGYINSNIINTRRIKQINKLKSYIKILSHLSFNKYNKIKD